MIRVTAFVTRHGQLDFGFSPEARFWVLHGVSLAQIETAIRAAISDRMPVAEPPNAAIASKVGEIAQEIIHDLVAQGVIEER